MIDTTVKLPGWNDLVIDFNHLVPANRKKFVLRGLGSKFLSLNRRRIRRQENPDGSRFPARKRDNKKAIAKIMSNTKKRKNVTVRVSDDNATIVNHNPYAYEHQTGFRRVERAWSAAEIDAREKKAKARHKKYLLGERRTRRGRAGQPERVEVGSAALTDSCTKEQAKYLREHWGEIWEKVKFDYGPSKKKNPSTRYKRHKRGRHRKWTIKRIRDAYTVAQAGFFIKAYRLAIGTPPKKRWIVNLPVREVMGLSLSDREQLFTEFRRLIAKYAYLQDKNFLHSPEQYREWAAAYTSGSHKTRRH